MGQYQVAPDWVAAVLRHRRTRQVQIRPLTLKIGCADGFS
jgi:hypothetical protein